MNEDLLQFVWQHKLLKPLPIISTTGKPIEILKHGELNRDSGADFFNAQIRINDLVLAGNIEIHVNSSDWLKHNHQNDTSYDNIILHAVYKADKIIPQNQTNNVEVIELKELIDESILSNYVQLAQSKNEILCYAQLETVYESKASAWINRMAIERLESKTETIEKVFASFNNDFTQTFYSVLLKNFGFKVNSLPFELLATYLPVNILLKHIGNQKQVEALVLGAAGMLEDFFEDKYLQNLQSEFEFLKNKYQLSVLNKNIFKYSRLRPANFPGLRLAQFTQLIFNNPKLLSQPQDLRSIQEIKQALSFDLEGYWKNHYKLDGEKNDQDLKLGESSIQNILVNTFSYFFFFYGKKLNKPFYENLALELLEDAAFESNAKTKTFHKLLCGKRSALVSQGLIHLKDNYCAKKLCLKCGIGAALLQKKE